MKLTNSLTTALATLALAGTIIYMAGLAAMQRSCWSDGMFPGLGGTPNAAIGAGPYETGFTNGIGAFGMSNTNGYCLSVFRLYWFIFAFVLVTLVALLATSGTYSGLHFSRPFWIGMVAVSTVLMIIASEAFLAIAIAYDNTGLGGHWLHQARDTAAGAIITTAFLVFLLMAVGTDWEHRRGADGRGAASEKPTTGVTGTGVGAAPAGATVARPVADTV